MRPRCYGFISPDDGGPEIFVHQQKFSEGKLPPPTKGASVSFEISTRGEKVFADKLAVFDRPAPAQPVFPRLKKQPEPELSFEEAFEKEWGLRRAKEAGSSLNR